MDRLTYTLDEACARLGITTRTAHRILAAAPTDRPELHPDVPAVRIGGRWKIPRRALDALLGVEEARAS